MKLTSNKLLIVFAIISVLGSMLITFFLLFDPFDKSDSLYVSGRTLYIKAYEPVIVENYKFLGSENSESSIKSPEGYKLAILNLEITNAASSDVRIISNEESSEFMSINGFTYKPINPFELSSNSQNQNTNLPSPIWGSYTLNIKEKLKGFLIFQVKESFQPKKFEWNASDRVVISFD